MQSAVSRLPAETRSLQCRYESRHRMADMDCVRRIVRAGSRPAGSSASAHLVINEVICLNTNDIVVSKRQLATDKTSSVPAPLPMSVPPRRNPTTRHGIQDFPAGFQQFQQHQQPPYLHNPLTNNRFNFVHSSHLKQNIRQLLRAANHESG